MNDDDLGLRRLELAYILTSGDDSMVRRALLSYYWGLNSCSLVNSDWEEGVYFLWRLSLDDPDFCEVTRAYAEEFLRWHRWAF